MWRSNFDLRSHHLEVDLLSIHAVSAVSKLKVQLLKTASKTAGSAVTSCITAWMVKSGLYSLIKEAKLRSVFQQFISCKSYSRSGLRRGWIVWLGTSLLESKTSEKKNKNIKDRNKGMFTGQVPHCKFYFVALLPLLAKWLSIGFPSQIATRDIIDNGS